MKTRSHPPSPAAAPPAPFLALCAAILFAAALAGCAVQTPRILSDVPAGLPRHTELVQTPFFPQEDYQCGPAALATALSAAGLPTPPGALVDQVFLPARRGSLQLEMLAGGRRNGAVTTPIPGTLDAVMREVAAGHPVVVLLNLGLSWWPLWHYAVVIGYDVDAGEFLLRSGTTARLTMPFRTFEHTWNRSQRWAFVALPPGALPATATEAATTRALVAFERVAPPDNAAAGYRTALGRWPDSLVLAMGLGNARHAAGDKAGAEAAFRDAAARHESAAAYNNHARVLLELGRRDEARRAAERAIALGGPLRDTALATLRAIDE